ncbi:unnamed protein product, partial [Urochloa humidicola]
PAAASLPHLPCLLPQLPIVDAAARSCASQLAPVADQCALPSSTSGAQAQSKGFAIPRPLPALAAVSRLISRLPFLDHVTCSSHFGHN